MLLCNTLTKTNRFIQNSLPHPSVGSYPHQNTKFLVIKGKEFHSCTMFIRRIWLLYNITFIPETSIGNRYANEHSIQYLTIKFINLYNFMDISFPLYKNVGPSSEPYWVEITIWAKMYLVYSFLPCPSPLVLGMLVSTALALKRERHVVQLNVVRHFTAIQQT